MTRLLYFALLLLGLTGPWTEADASEPERWVSVTGKSMLGTLERATPHRAWIRGSDGKVASIPTVQLDTESRARVRAWRQAQITQPSYGRDIRGGSARDRGNAPEEDALRQRERALAETINDLRREHGLEPLDFDPEAADVARAHSEHMARADFFAHEDPDGKQVWDRLAEADVRNSGSGENIAANLNVEDADATAVTGWMNSPGHRANILTKGWRSTGMGIARKADGTWLFTQVFLK